MLSDDEFLRNVLPHLRAKRAAQGRKSDSLHHSSGQPSSPKNDPNGQDRSELWFPASLTQLSKYGKTVTLQVRAYAEPVSAALSSEVDGWITLNEQVMNGRKEKVKLVSLRSWDRTDGDGVTIGHRRVLELIGLELQPPRRYFVTMKIMNDDPRRYKLESLWNAWTSRRQAREDAGQKIPGWISSDKLRNALTDSDDEDSYRKMFIEAMEADGRGEELAKHLKAEEMSKRLFGKSRKL